MHAAKDTGERTLTSNASVFSFAEINGRQDNDPTAAALPWEQFCSQFSIPVPRGSLTLAEYQALDTNDPEQKRIRDAQKDGPAWLPATFKTGGKRVKDDVLSVTAFVGDFDDGEMKAEEIQQQLHGLEHFLHTTYSHSPAKAKRRVVVPFRKPIAPKHLAIVFDHFNSRLGGHLDPVGRKPAQLYYKPSCPHDAERLFQWYRGSGQFFDPEALTTPTDLAPGRLSEGRRVERFGRMTTMPPPCRDGQRHPVALSAIGRWLEQGFDRVQLLSLVREWNDANIDPWPNEKVRPIVESMLRTDQRNHPERHLPDPWTGVAIPDGYQLSHNGVYQLFDKPSKPDLKLSGPVWMSAAARDLQSKSWGRLIDWIDGEGQRHQAAIPAERFHEQGNALSQELARDGLVIVPGREKALATYLGLFKPHKHLRSVPRLGWLDDARGRLVFIQPERAYGKNAEEPHVFQPERHSPTAATIRTQGTLAEWQEAVAARIRGNPLLVFGVCAAFAGPLLKPLNIESGGFHLFGRSSHGKTTLAQVAASAWGCGADPAADPALSYVQRWNTTQNGLEGLASAHNDGLIVLDEIGTCNARDFGQVIYTLAGGRGKVAMNAERNLKQVRTWRLLFLSTGEISARQKMEEDDRTPRAGQLLRMLDIPILAGVVEDPHGLPPTDYVNGLKTACSDIHGSAGPAFLEAIVKAFDDFDALTCALKPRLKRTTADIAVHGLEAEQTRALRRLALVAVAGELAAEFGLLPFSRAEILAAVKTVRDAWLQDQDILTDADRGVELVRAFILTHKSRFQDLLDLGEAGEPDVGEAAPVDLGPPIRDQAGFVDRKRRLFLLTVNALREALRGIDSNAVLRELDRRDLLFRQGKDRFTSKHPVPGLAKRVSFYAVRFRVLEDEPRKDPGAEK